MPGCGVDEDVCQDVLGLSRSVKFVGSVSMGEGVPACVRMCQGFQSCVMLYQVVSGCVMAF